MIVLDMIAEFLLFYMATGLIGGSVAMIINTDLDDVSLWDVVVVVLSYMLAWPYMLYVLLKEKT